MIAKTMSLLCIVLILGSQFSQAGNLDLKTRQLIQLTTQFSLKKPASYASMVHSQPLLKHFPITQNMNDESFASALARVDISALNDGELFKLGIHIQSRMGNIYSLTIPLHALKDLSEIQGLAWIELARRARLKLDASRIEIRADHVHNGEAGLSQSYTGEGVILGIIDSGIDFSHPDFKHADGTTRIISIWDQHDASGTPPAGIDYGTEWTSVQINRGQCTHKDPGTHGTHVTGIAAGNGFSRTDRRYKGIAPDAELICVAAIMITPKIIDAVNYIIQKAAGRPMVINLSLGTHEGPHDGTSLLDQAFDNISGPGKILVGAVGNEADRYVHVGTTLSNDSSFTCFAQMNDSLDYLDTKLIDLWGGAGADLNIAILAVDASGSVKFRRESRKENVSYEFTEDGEKVAWFMIGYEMNSQNGHPHYNLLGVYYEPSNHYEWYLKVAGSGSFDAWTEENLSGVNFKPDKPPAFPYGSDLYLPGDNEKCVGEIGGTAHSVISVGAYTTKNQWTDYLGISYDFSPFVEYGELAPFSSRGPTRDGRLKPEITAPGNIVVAALSQDADLEELNPARIIALPNSPELTNGYVGYEGSSMAAPHVAGTVALMLEAKSNLAPSDVSILLQRNAHQDNFTGSGVSNQWGHGKADAFKTVIATENFTGVPQACHSIPDGIELFENYPNPFNSSTTIQFKLSKPSCVSLEVYNCLGEEVNVLISKEMNAGRVKIHFNAEHLNSGVYFYKLIADNIIRTKKMVLVK